MVIVNIILLSHYYKLSSFSRSFVGSLLLDDDEEIVGEVKKKKTSL